MSMKKTILIIILIAFALSIIIWFSTSGSNSLDINNTYELPTGSQINIENIPSDYKETAEGVYAVSDDNEDGDQPYTIFYYTETDSYAVSLNKEPLAEIRKQAELYLLSTSGLTQEQLCKNGGFVGTTYDINHQYAGVNLGFSFCPGAVVLE